MFIWPTVYWRALIKLYSTAAFLQMVDSDHKWHNLIPLNLYLMKDCPERMARKKSKKMILFCGKGSWSSPRIIRKKAFAVIHITSVAFGEWIRCSKRIAPAGKGLTSWLSFVVSNCEFVTFPLVSWVRCGNWLYRFLIFATLLTFFTLE